MIVELHAPTENAVGRFSDYSLSLFEALVMMLTIRAVNMTFIAMFMRMFKLMF